MGRKLLVAVGTDGVTDWVRLPTGQKMNLGTVSVLKFVTSVGLARSARQVLDAVMADGEAMLSVDEDQLWDLLTPRRVVWGSLDPFMACDPRTTRDPMTTIREDLTHLEVHIAELNKHAKTASPAAMAEGREILVRLAKRIPLPSQVKNASYFSLSPAAVAPAAPAAVAPSAPLNLAFDTVQANTGLAHQILAKAEETVDQIEKLASAGRKFNAARAKADVHAVTTKVAGILKADLTASWVQDDLKKLADRGDHLHGLFIKPKA